MNETLLLGGTTLTVRKIEHETYGGRRGGSNRIIIRDHDDITTMTKIIYLYTSRKNVLSTNLWNQKQNKRQKQPHSEIEYKDIEICTIVSYFAFKYFSTDSYRWNLLFSSLLTACQL